MRLRYHNRGRNGSNSPTAIREVNNHPEKLMEKGSISFSIRIAKKPYRCPGGPYHVCNRAINTADVYFAFTMAAPKHYTTQRYCLECAHKLHPDLLKKAKAEIKSKRKRQSVSEKAGRLQFKTMQAVRLRKNMTTQEKYVWDFLKSNQLGARFQAQFLLHGFVVDFWCAAKQLVVEIDGAQHRSMQDKDRDRDDVLRKHGIRVLRFPSQIVFTDIALILDSIKEKIHKL